MHLLCIGGSDGGISAALRARELDSSVEVTVMLADAYPNYSICAIAARVGVPQSEDPVDARSVNRVAAAPGAHQCHNKSGHTMERSLLTGGARRAP